MEKMNVKNTSGAKATKKWWLLLRSVVSLLFICVCSEAPPLTGVSTSYLKYQTKCCDVTKHQCPANSLCVCVLEKELNWTLFPVMHSFLFFLHLPVTLCRVPSFPASLSLPVSLSYCMQDALHNLQASGIQQRRETGHSVSVCRWTWCPERDKQEAHWASRTLTAQSAWHCSQAHTCSHV